MSKSYWTELGLAAKKSLQDMKILVEENGVHHYRHPKLSEIKFEQKQSISLPTLSRKERREKFEKERTKRKEKLNTLPYSDFHNKLINEAYGKTVNTLKKSALEAAHEERIQNIIIRNRIIRSIRVSERNAKKQTVLVVNKCYDWKITPFTIIPSSNTIDCLRKIANNLAKKLTTSMKYFFNIEVWDKNEYLKSISGDRHAHYYYSIGKSYDTTDTNKAA